MVKLIAPFAFLAFAAAADPFKWQPCPDVGKPVVVGLPDSKNPLLRCGSLTVPIDYSNAAKSETIEIAVRRYQTNSTQRLGTILLNPGGPGGSGLAMGSPSYIKLTGGLYDVLGFDPRGVGKSRRIKCSKNSYTDAVENERRDVKEIPFMEATSETSIGRFGAELDAQARRCQKYDGDYIKHISTATVARDMDAIRAALNEPVTNFLGYSYGTHLGATYVNMFPDRVGRIAIDSVVDPSIQTGPYQIRRSQSDSPLVLQAFLDECQKAGPLRCPLANPSDPDLFDTLSNFVDKVGENPLVLPTDDGDFYVLGAAEIRGRIFSALYRPTGWVQLADYLARLLGGKPLPGLSNPDTCPLPAPAPGYNMITNAVWFNDGDNSEPVDWNYWYEEAKNNVPFFGLPASNAVQVQYWKIKPVERYAGPWDKTLKQPILILQNQLDPTTGLGMAQHTAELMGDNAVLVVRDGYGHATTNMPSTCIKNIMLDFFVNGTLPEPDTTCPVDVGPFDAPLERSTDDDGYESAREAANEILNQVFEATARL
ncbi:Aste57867_9891 [Aphanomyces stellatus]|uniref:Aste57867_9891 protein n=1 Tax=Aphanomyces stellatus TaxID=120398 RepID=A0A485KP04_9STRA|nr:hypothetical protein As57867_009852 [Aphanomyces stellatus]VFT86770.1 Aste57867_9891 [Aphanomyces stellatus]